MADERWTVPKARKHNAAGPAQSEFVPWAHGLSSISEWACDLLDKHAEAHAEVCATVCEETCTVLPVPGTGEPVIVHSELCRIVHTLLDPERDTA